MILPGSGRDQLGSRRDQLRMEVILPGSPKIDEDCCDLAEISSGSAGITPGSAQDRRDLAGIS